MAKRRVNKELEVIKTPCELANDELKAIHGNWFNITREQFEELMQYEVIPKEVTKDWIIRLNELSRDIMRVMVSPDSIKNLCGSCGAAKSTIERLHRPLMQVLNICKKHAEV